MCYRCKLVEKITAGQFDDEPNPAAAIEALVDLHAEGTVWTKVQEGNDLLKRVLGQLYAVPKVYPDRPDDVPAETWRSIEAGLLKLAAIYHEAARRKDEGHGDGCDCARCPNKEAATASIVSFVTNKAENALRLRAEKRDQRRES